MIIVENGSGVRGANSYVNEGYVTSYLTLRNKVTDWTAASSAEKTAAILGATAYLEMRFSNRFLGYSEIFFEEIKATAEVTISVVPTSGDALIVDGVRYEFGDNVAIGATVTDCAESLAAALSGPVSATAAGGTLTLTAAAPGAGGNLTALTVDGSGSIAATAFSGGSDEGSHSLSFPRTGFSGVPSKIRDAVSEYAARAIISPLAPDPGVSSSGGAVLEKEEMVGPILERTVYQSGTYGSFFFTPYPEADKLVAPFIASSGRVIRG